MTDRIFKPDSGTDLVFEDAGSTDRLRITDGGSIILYEDGGAAALTIDTGGQVGIGTATPAVLLEVSSATSAIRCTDTDGPVSIQITADGTQGWLYTVGNHPLKFATSAGATTAMTIATNDNVGIGTPTPAVLLEVSDATPAIRCTDTDGPVSIQMTADAAQGWLYTVGSHPMKFATSAGATTAMTIGTSDNVGIPTINASHKLQVTGSAGLSTGTAWTNTSDERIKTNIKTIENALDKIKLLRPVSFNYSKDYLDQHSELSDSKTYNSFIAQEYEEVFPDAVSVGENLEKITIESVEAKEAVFDKEGNEISPAVEAVEEVREIIVEDMLQFTPHDLNMYLVGAVQELSAKVTALENA